MIIYVCCISTDKISKPPVKTEVEVNSKDNKSLIAKVNPSLYKKLIIDDLTSIGMYYLFLFFLFIHLQTIKQIVLHNNL